jgi:uncharacterized membrane protein YphA (DoxX/SURF4 family)
MTVRLAAAVPFLPTHERWFVESQPGGDWSFFFSPLPLVLTAAVVAVALIWRLVALRIDGPELPFLAPLGRLVPWVPRLLGVHLGVALLALAATGAFITPSNDHLDGVGGNALLLVEGALGVWLVTGFRLRPAAAMVLLLGPVLVLVDGFTALGECANLAAVAAFLVVLAPGQDAHGAVHPTREQLRLALLLLRLGVGAALIVLGFSEKLTNPAMAIDTLERYPALDVFALVGIDVAPETFVAIAGATELLFGVLVISGALPQVAVLVAMVPFNATLLLFGQTEMVGHLPVYGVFLALLVYGSNALTAPEVRWLPLPGRSVGGRDVHPAPAAPLEDAALVQ